MDFNNLGGLASLLTKIDPNIISSLLGNINLGSSNSKGNKQGAPNILSSLLGNIDLSQVMGLVNNLSSSTGHSQNKNSSLNRQQPLVGLNLLNEIKPMLDKDKGDLIDMVAQCYRIYKLLG